jgi:hypothetical protein
MKKGGATKDDAFFAGIVISSTFFEQFFLSKVI